MNTNFKIVISSITFFIILALSFKSYNSILEEEVLLDEKNPNIVELEPYTKINIASMSADISIKKGEDFTLEYKLHPREKLNIISVEDDTFNFGTDFTDEYRENWDTELYNWFLILTIPHNVELESLDIVTIEGEIFIEDWKIDNINIKTTTGDIWLDNINANSMKLTSISGDIDIYKSNIDMLTINNISESIVVEGRFNTVELSSMSDSISFKGMVGNSLEISSVSGNINATFQEEADIKATSFKNIIYNDMRNKFTFEYKVPRNYFDNNLPKVELKSTSGRIKIDTIEYLNTKKN